MGRQACRGGRNVASAWGQSWGVAWGDSWGSVIPKGFIDYQGDGKKRRRRKRKTDELFAELEASVRAMVVGEPALAPSSVARHAVTTETPAYRDALARLADLATGYDDLDERVQRLQRDIAEYEERRNDAIRLEEEDEEESIMLLLS